MRQQRTEGRKKDYDNANLENAVNVMSIYDKKKYFFFRNKCIE